MGFEPQTANQPLVNTHRRTTKVNIAMAIAVVIFFIIGLAYAIRKPTLPQPEKPVSDQPVPEK